MMADREKLIERVEGMIRHYQSKADELKLAVDEAIDSDQTINVYKWMHSLWRSCCNFVADLDTLAAHCEVAEFVENCEDCGFCDKHKKGNNNMIIKKMAEANMDESVFWGKVEVETDSKSEWERVARILESIKDDDVCVCHCNLKENAERIAEILDYDIAVKVAPNCGADMR